jgi:RNA polymerase sigma-70 factor (ECF subfamily)
MAAEWFVRMSGLADGRAITSRTETYDVAVVPELSEPTVDSFERLFRDHYHDVWRYASFMLRSTSEAEDIASQAFAQAYAAWIAGRGPSGPPRAWLLVITRRIVLNRARRARILHWLPLQTVARRSREDRTIAESEFRLWLDQLARTLRPAQREALFLRYLDDLTDKDAGAVMGLSPSGFRTLVSRALARLRDQRELWE